MNDEQKQEIITASRGTLENEQYRAELDLKLAEAGSDESLTVEPRERLEVVNRKLAILDDEQKKAGG